VELRLLGLVAFVWVAAVLQAGGWGWVAIGPTEPPENVPWQAVLIPQLLALEIVLAYTVTQLPAVRWHRRGSFLRLPSPLPLLVLGAPALPFVPFLLWRDRRVRQRSTPATPDEHEAAFQALLRLPRAVGLQFLTWGGLAFIGDAAILSVHYGWSRGQLIGVAILWLALLGPLAAIVGSLAHAILRPEQLTAPRPGGIKFQRTGDLKLRLAVPASIASIGAIAAPLMAGYLWMHSLGRSVGVDQAENIARELVALASDDRQERLGRVLGQNSNATLRRGNRVYGKPRASLPEGTGRIDDNGDGFVDLVVRRAGGIAALVPVRGPTPLSVELIAFTAITCLVSTVGSIVLIARNVHRDVARASLQVESVADGRAPTPLREASFLSYEIRELVQSVDRLVSRISEANVAKYVAIERAKEADRLKSQFLANMSHDLRSPLNSILGFSELLLTGIDGELTEDQREMLKTVHDSGRELLQQIDDILDTAKLDAGRMGIQAEPTPAAALISRAITNARRRQPRNIEYETEIAAGLPPSFADPYRTVQALENVLLFASERMESGTIHVKLRLGQTEAGRMLFIQITTPVSPATTEQLTLALRGFHRIPGHRGLGLGLPIAGAILELEHGSLGIEDLGEGMTFSIQIPAPEARRRLRIEATE
jgi:signal transduction histidine kinase